MAFTIHPESPNKQAVALVESAFREVEPKLRGLLPELTDELQLYVYDEDIIPETGTGGYAYSPTILSLAIDNDFTDKTRQYDSLIGTIFHESYHLVQGHTGNDARAERRTALDSAIYEGCATIFENNYTNEKPLWGDYSQCTQQQLQGWRTELSRISMEDWLANDGELWQRWSFYDDNDGQRWKLYKVGTWTVEAFLKKTGQDVRDLRRMAASEIV